MIVQQQTPESLTRRRPWRFSLRTLFILTTLFCVWFGTWANSAHRQKRAVEAIERSGGQFSYTYQKQGTPKGIGQGQVYSHRVQAPGPRWLRRLLGDHYFITPSALKIINQTGIQDDCFRHLRALSSLENIYLHDVPVRQSDVDHLRHVPKLRNLTFNDETLPGPDGPRRFDFLKHLSQLESLSLNDSQFGDRDAKYLEGMARLKVLFIYDSEIGDDGLAHLQNLNNLTMLGLSRTNVTSDGMGYLSNLPNLSYVSLSDTKLDDSAINAFVGMKALTEIELHRSGVTPEGIRKLREALPRCRVNGEGGSDTPAADNLMGL